MQVLKATQAQYEALNGFTNSNNAIQFIKDGNNNWIVGLRVLEHSAFTAIHADLDALERIEYLPPEPEGMDGI